MARTPDEQQAKAEMRFKRSQPAADREQAMAEYEAEAKAVRARSVKLKTLRLAKEAEDEAAAENAPKAMKRTRKAPNKA